MKETKKIFGIYADTFNGKVGQTFAYMQFFSQFGYVRLISTCDNLNNIVNEIDVLVIPGGADVDASLYSSIPGVMDSRTNQHYEYLDKLLINKFVQSKKPIIGICRGMQRLNVYFGGTLVQNITGHHQGDNRVKTDQEVYLLKNIEDNIFESKINVNSMHHQCIGKLGENLKIIGFSELYAGSYIDNSDTHLFKRLIENKDKKLRIVDLLGVPEIIIHENLPIIGFQYHPEEFNCNIAVDLINNIL